MKTTSLRYELSGVDLATVSRHTRELCAELDRPGRLREELKAVGVDASAIPSFSGLAVVEADAHGLDYTTIGAVVALSLPFAKAGAAVTQKALLDIWRKILLPRLEQRLGKGSLIEKADSDSDAAPAPSSPPAKPRKRAPKKAKTKAAWAPKRA